MITTRGQLKAAFLATLVCIAALSWYGWSALESAADDGRRIHDDLARLRAVSVLEDDLRGLAASAGDRVEMTLQLERDLGKFMKIEASPEDEPALRAFTDAVAAARARPSAEAWYRAEEASGVVEERMIKRSQRWETMEHAQRRAKHLLLIGATLVASFGVLSIVVFRRWRSEERQTQDHLRRSDRLAALGTIAASVAHEINNPLATISGCATAVRDRLRRDKGDNADAVEYLDMVVDESRRCTRIVKSLHDLAREGPPAVAPADLPQLARSVVQLLELDRKATPVAFVVLGDEQIEAMCDPDKLKQLLLNLLINARDASQPGGRVTVRVERIGDATARISVADDGRGIDRRDLARIFEPFHTDKTQGLGIGLFLCERIAAQHGGTIRAESPGRGKGATFVVEFPTRTSGNVPSSAVS